MTTELTALKELLAWVEARKDEIRPNMSGEFDCEWDDAAHHYCVMFANEIRKAIDKLAVLEGRE